MDVWIKILSEKGKTKIVTLVTTPFLKSCRNSDIGWNRCGESRKCIREELFCDGHINCDGEDEAECKEDLKIKATSIELDKSVLIGLSVIVGSVTFTIVVTV